MTNEERVEMEITARRMYQAFKNGDQELGDRIWQEWKEKIAQGLGQ